MLVFLGMVRVGLSRNGG